MDFAAPAPEVGAAVADKPPMSESVRGVEAAIPSRAPEVESVRAVGPAETVDDPHKYAPVISKQTNNPALLNVANLRGTAGADFESKAAVLRGKPVKSIMQRLLPLCYEERDYIAYGEVERFVLIKGGSCFIFVDETHPSALYVIELEELVPVLENPRKPDKNSFTISPRTIDHNLARRENVSPDTMQTVLLRYRDGKHAYQFTFDIGASGDKSTVKRFMDAITQATSKEVAAYTASAVRTKDGGKGDAKA